MKSFAARCWKCLLALGLAFLLISLIPSNVYSSGSHVDYGTYEGRVFNAAGNTHMTVYTYSSNGLCFYILTYDDLMIVLENASLESVSPLVMMEGVTNFSLELEIPAPGLYAYLVTPCQNETIYFDVTIAQPIPHTGMLLVGVILSSGALALLLIVRLAIQAGHHRAK